MSDDDKKQVANDILLAVIKAVRLPLWAICGFVASEFITLVCVGIQDHFTLSGVVEVQKNYLIPKVGELWDDHWKQDGGNSH